MPMDPEEVERRLAAPPRRAIDLDTASWADPTTWTNPNDPNNCSECGLPRNPCECEPAVPNNDFDKVWISKLQNHLSSWPRSIQSHQNRYWWCNKAMDLCLELKENAEQSDIDIVSFPKFPEGVTVLEEKPWEYKFEGNCRSAAVASLNIVDELANRYERWQKSRPRKGEDAGIYETFSPETNAAWEKMVERWQSDATKSLVEWFRWT